MKVPMLLSSTLENIRSDIISETFDYGAHEKITIPKAHRGSRGQKVACSSRLQWKFIGVVPGWSRKNCILEESRFSVFPVTRVPERSVKLYGCYDF